MNKNETTFSVGTRIGFAIADTVLRENLPHEWTGLDPQDGDQLTSAGLEPKTPEWDIAEKAAENAYHQLIFSLDVWRLRDAW